MLVVNKPRGMISKDVSRTLTRLLGKQKLGHVGTLDPNAEGVLPLLFGNATRLQDFLLELPKTYDFDVSFGAETDSMDPDGTVIRTAPWEHVTVESINAAIKGFHGRITQVPPMYSAVKYQGRPLYEYARGQRDSEVPLADLSREVVVSDFRLLGFANGVAHCVVTCSKGTYIRSLVKSLAEALGTCATLTRLLRSAASGVDLSCAHRLEHVEEKAAAGEFGDLLISTSAIQLGVPRWAPADPAIAGKLRSGVPVRMAPKDFVSAFGLEERAILPSVRRQGLMLLDHVGAAVGLGDAFLDEHGRVTVSMRRGL